MAAPPQFHEILQYLLVEDKVVGEEVDGVVDQQGVEVVVLEKVFNVSLEVINEVESVDHGVEALAPGSIVVLESGDDSEGEGLP